MADASDDDVRPDLDARGPEELGGGPRPAGADDEGRVAPDAELEQVLRRAHGYGDEGDFDAMAVTLREALETWPDDAFLLCWLAVAERELGLGGIAYEHFKACLAREPRDPHVLATAGNAIAAFDDPEAEPALRTAALLGPDVALTRWLYGAYLALAERHDRAVDAFFRATELDPDDAWARVVLGLALVEDGRADEAAGELERGARDRPEDLEAQVLAALAAAAAGYEDRAWEMLERARLVGPEAADARLVTAAEERLDAGPEASATFLDGLVAGAYRERLMARP